MICIHIMTLWTRFTCSWVILHPFISRTTNAIFSMFIHYGWMRAYARAISSSISECTFIAFAMWTNLIPIWIFATNFSGTYVSSIIYGVFARSFTVSIFVHIKSRLAWTISRSSSHFTISHSRTYRWVTIVSRIWTRKYACPVCQIFISKCANTWSSSFICRDVTVSNFSTFPFHRFVAVICHISAFYWH